jgi:hypothetical protein
MFQKLKMASVVVGILFFLLTLLAVLQYYRFQTLLFEVNSSRISVSAQALKSDIERSLALGLPLQSNAQLKIILESAIEKYPDIESLQLVDTKADLGQVFWESGEQTSAADTQHAVAGHRQIGKEMWFDASSPSHFVQVWSIRDPLGHSVADLILRVDNDAAKLLLVDARTHLLRYWLLLCLASMLFLAPILIYLFLSLDRLIGAAGAILKGETPNTSGDRSSEICDLAAQVAQSGLTVQPQNQK